MSKTFFSFLLTIIAGFSTLLGLIPIFFKIKNINKFICACLSFASGVMFTLSITDLIPEGINMLSNKFNSFLTILITFIFLVLGIIISMIIDNLLPEEVKHENKKLYKVGIVSMLAIILHNIPEGILTFVVGNSNQTLAFGITLAIALHNIPEGISIAIPIYYSTKSKTKSITYTLISALSEPLGALIAYLFLSKFNTEILLGILFSIIAGIMLQISLCELLKTSIKYNHKKITTISFIIGTLLMLLKFII